MSKQKRGQKPTMRQMNNIEENHTLAKIQKIFNEDLNPILLTQKQFDKIFINLRTIGEGSYGSIKCFKNVYNQEYVLKQFKQNDSMYGGYREVAIMKKFNHPNLLKMIGFYKVVESQKLYMLTQYCQHKSLKAFSYLLQNMDNNEKLRLILDIFNGIYALHEKNIMHRDLKPENILIDKNKRAKVCDYGFCIYDYEQEMKKSRKVGTPLYNSPETQYGQYTKKCDLFSFGLIAYFIFTNGKHLFKVSQTSDQLKSSRKEYFKNQSEVLKQCSDMPNEIKELLCKTVTQKEDDRASTSQICQFLKRIIRQKQIEYQFITSSTYNKSINTNDKNQNKDPNLQNLTVVSEIFKRLQANNTLQSQIQTYSFITSTTAKINTKLMELNSIQNLNLTKTQKYLVAFGFLYILEIGIEKILFQVNQLLKSLKQKEQMNAKLEPQKKRRPSVNRKNVKSNQFEFQAILIMKVQKAIQLATRVKKSIYLNLMQITKYIQLIKQLIKPVDLLTHFIRKCLQDIQAIYQMRYLDNQSLVSVKSMEMKKETSKNENSFYTMQENHSRDSSLMNSVINISLDDIEDLGITVLKNTKHEGLQDSKDKLDENYFDNLLSEFMREFSQMVQKFARFTVYPTSGTQQSKVKERQRNNMTKSEIEKKIRQFRLFINQL